MSSEPVAAVRDDGYGDVYARHRAAIYRLAVLLSGDLDVAEEVTADVFARVLPKWRAGKVIDPLAYLRRATVNEMRSRWRRLLHERRAAAHVAPASTAAAEERVLLRDPLVRALAQLPLQQRSVVVLRYLDDLSEAEVGRTLSMAPGTVKSHASRGVSRLRDLLAVSPQEETR